MFLRPQAAIYKKKNEYEMCITGAAESDVVSV